MQLHIWRIFFLYFTTAENMHLVIRRNFSAAMTFPYTPINHKHYKGIGSSLPVQNDVKSF